MHADEGQVGEALSSVVSAVEVRAGDMFGDFLQPQHYDAVQGLLLSVRYLAVVGDTPGASDDGGAFDLALLTTTMAACTLVPSSNTAMLPP